MNTTMVESGKWSKFGDKLKTIIIENNNRPKTERKTLSDIFKDFASNYDTTFFSAQQYYYTEIKPNLKKSDTVLSIDDSIEEFSKIGYQSKNVRDIYKVGQIIEVQIISISDFGVFAKTKEGFEGLLHISQIATEFVDVPEDYFYIGEKVEVKIIRFDGDKLSFSTRAIGGKKKINPVFKDLAKKQIKSIEKEIKSKELNTVSEVNVSNSMSNNDMENIISFIKKYTDNKVSDQSMQIIEELVSKFGVFKTTMSLMETVKDLDISLMLSEMLKDKLEGNCLRQTH